MNKTFYCIRHKAQFLATPPGVLVCSGLRGESVAESRVARFAQLADVQGPVGVQRPRAERSQTLPRRLLAELRQPERVQPRRRRIRNFRVSYFRLRFGFRHVEYRYSFSSSICSARLSKLMTLLLWLITPVRICLVKQ